MTLARRIIPCLDTDGSRVVKGVNFVNLRDAGDPAVLAARYNQEGADELVVLDIAASRDYRSTFLETVQRVAAELAIPLTAGGGVHTVDEGRAILRAGADKLTVNTAALRRPELLTELAAEFGSQAVVLAIDAKRVPAFGENAAQKVPVGQDVPKIVAPGDQPAPRTSKDLNVARQARASSGHDAQRVGAPSEQDAQRVGAVRQDAQLIRWEAFVRGGRDSSGRDALAWAQEGVERGAGEILLTSMDRDGTRAGFDLALTAAISTAVNVPVIASGGADTPQTFLDVFVEGRADAALAASIFHDSVHGLGDLKRFLAARGLPIRLTD